MEELERSGWYDVKQRKRLPYFNRSKSVGVVGDGRYAWVIATCR
jgi:GMP synthase PP-ATPase subunit